MCASNGMNSLHLTKKKTLFFLSINTSRDKVTCKIYWLKHCYHDVNIPAVVFSEKKDRIKIKTLPFVKSMLARKLKKN